MVTPHEPRGYCKEESDVCPSIFLPLSRVFSEISKIATPSFYGINIGANDGVTADPVYPILTTNPDFHLLALEPNVQIFEKLKRNLIPFKNARPLNVGVYASTATSVANDFPNPSMEDMDILKIDIDSCDCHILENLMLDKRYHAKIVQVELNHIITPPVAYKDMCRHDVHGRSSGNLDVWGCSMQAAFDIVESHGYFLLQYDWPDATFVKKAYSHAFPCFTQSFEETYWIGYHHARKHYTRFSNHVTNRTFAFGFPDLAKDGKKAIDAIVDQYRHTFTKRPLWIEMYDKASNYKRTLQGR